MRGSVAAFGAIPFAHAIVAQFECLSNMNSERYYEKSTLLDLAAGNG
jgi:hypothetical protein